MQIQPGLCIRSTAALQGSYFEDSVILITRTGEDGATGFVVNQRFGRYLDELEEFKNDKAMPLWEGGPVDQEHLFFTHTRPDLIEEGEPIENGLYSGGNFQQAVKAINAGTLQENEIKIFIGYCGWDAGELEAEIAEGSWEALQAFDPFSL